MVLFRLALLALAATPFALAKDKNPRFHFYTIRPDGESARAAGYIEQGTDGYAYAGQVGGTAAMYRCVNGQSGAHLYTFEQNCEGASGFSLEGIAWWCYPGQTGNTVSLDRYYTVDGDHWYVVRGQEVGQPDQAYYRFEKSACYVYGNQTDGTVPIYSWVKGNLR